MQNQMLLTHRGSKLINKMLFDEIPNSQAAFSLRKLRTSYTGSAIRVRRSTDNSELDIGFTNQGDLDEATLINFVGVGNGHVTTWYDQSGNDIHCTNSVQAEQPLIIKNGVILKLKGRPYVYFDGGSFLISTYNVSLQAATYIAVGGYDNVRPILIRGIFGSGGAAGGIIAVNGNTMCADGAGAGGPNNSAVISLSRYNAIFQATYSTSTTNNSTISINNDAIDFTGTGVTRIAAKLSIGNRGLSIAEDRTWTGMIQECIYYESLQYEIRPLMMSNMNIYYSLYWDNSKQLLLNKYGLSTWAFSVRLLNANHNKPLFAIQRNTDASILDIWPDRLGDPDQWTLTKFIKNNNATVRAWYNQSETSSIYDLINTLVNNQPSIIRSGVLHKMSSKPTIYFNTSTYNLASTQQNVPVSNATYSVGRKEIENTFFQGLGSAQIDRYALTHLADNTIRFRGSLNSFSISDSTYDWKTNQVLFGNSDNGIFKVYRNNISVSLTNTVSAAFELTVSQVYMNPGRGIGFLQEAVGWYSSKDNLASEIQQEVMNYYNISRPAPQSLLDQYEGSVAAYSLRKLNQFYNGPAIRVRRTDNTELDINTSLSGLNESQLSTFVGSGNGFVTTIYDQSGNGNHLVQTTTANQPLIVSNGVINKVNNKPAILFDGVNDWFRRTFTIGNVMTRFVVMAHLSPQDDSTIILDDGATPDRAYLTMPLANTLRLFSGTNFYYPAVANNTQFVTYNLFNAANSQAFTNNNSLSTGSVSAGTFTYNGVTIGSRGGVTPGYYGSFHLQELIMFPNNQSTNRSDIMSNINSFYQIY